MEVAREVQKRNVLKNRPGVSILIEMEVAREDRYRQTSRYPHGVSILIEMEVAREGGNNPLFLMSLKRFNPY